MKTLSVQCKVLFDGNEGYTFWERYIIYDDNAGSFDVKEWEMIANCMTVEAAGSFLVRK